METQLSELEVMRSARGTCTYRQELWHPGLNKHRLIRGPDAQIVQRKALVQAQDWAEKWRVVEERNRLQQTKEEKKELAAERTAEAESRLAELESILAHTLTIDDTVDWERLKDYAAYSIPKPPPPAPTPAAPEEPSRDGFEPKLGLLDRLVPSRRERRVREANERYEQAIAGWRTQVAALQGEERSRRAAYQTKLATWESGKASFLQAQEDSNAAVDREKAAYVAKNPDANRSVLRLGSLEF